MDGASCRPGGVWLVRAGDTLGEIALRCGVSLKALARENGIDPPYMIRIGQRLRIPRKEATSARKVSRPVSTQPKLMLHPPAAGESRWVDDGKGHHGRFYAQPIGQVVRAAADGRVVAVTTLPFYGRVVLVEHPHGYITVYAYLLKASVRNGQQVSAGQRLGHVGVNPQTGEPGVYFELRRGKRQIDLRRWRHWAE